VIVLWTLLVVSTSTVVEVQKFWDKGEGTECAAAAAVINNSPPRGVYAVCIRRKQ
jgi:hypothetical protein